jgi:hypothetical protein
LDTEIQISIHHFYMFAMKQFHQLMELLVLVELQLAVLVSVPQELALSVEFVSLIADYIQPKRLPPAITNLLLKLFS